jgi:hypothetical protein
MMPRAQKDELSSAAIPHLEVLRERWRRYRNSLRLLDPEAEDFFSGGLVRFAPDVAVRLLILPPDPEAATVELDSKLGEWLKDDHPNPFGGPPTDWGRQTKPSAEAAVRFESYTNEQWNWGRFLALHRHGGMECGMGEEVVGRWNQGEDASEVKVFRLVPIVGRLWCALGLYSEAQEAYGITGPFEVSLAIRGTRGSVLGNLGAGWEEPSDAIALTPPTCPENHVLIRREVEMWPKDEGCHDLAISLGAAIEDAWGVEERRFLARIGDASGSFDTSRYS